MFKKEWTSRLSAAGLAALVAIGCGPDSTSGGLALVHVSLAQAGAAPSAALSPELLTSGVIDLTNVAKLDATLNAVELQTSGSDWQHVDLTTSLPLHLLALPGTGSAISLGDVTVEAGTCQARLFVSDLVIQFKQDVTVGMATFNKDVDYTAEVRIPSGDQTGLKADGICNVVSGQTNNVTLAFDAASTVGTIAVTGSGSILITPVIHILQVP